MPITKKPGNLKSISGTSRNDREEINAVELPLADAVPNAPDWLPNAHAVKEWERFAPILHANKLLTEAGLSALATLCALHGKIVQLFAAGECPTGHLLSQYRNLINDFGLTPVAQGKLKQTLGNEKTNPFAKFKRSKSESDI